ncbi:unnamed protein product [Arctia plantaginis]|uniref:Uncharacterized protein n=1 Tax=Arctia plantaginis TaxID=874455 RepID=A0A8S1BQL6_ARCPL|nr:unnamed protein product [Arctia plantaginis]
MDLPPYDKFLKLLKATMWLEGTAYGNPKIEKRFYIIACIVSIMVSSEAAFFFLNMSSENFIELAQSAPCFVAVIYYTTADGFYVVLSSQICANFCVISDMIENLDATNIDTLNDIVKAHQNILKLSDDLEDIFMVPNLFNMLTGALQICALGLNILIGPWEEIPGCLLFLVSVLMQILMMSIFGENIIRDSTKVGDAAYRCSWYNMDSKSRKTILYVMIRSHKAQKLTAYKFSVICYSSFSKIISSSWSYFTILQTLYKLSDTNKA